ncbi:hypothetical protein HK405_004123 [Cladochytrium tenue]|nr:hypothetical protein HK405_004123 [Cladochytrium tenue]
MAGTFVRALPRSAPPPTLNALCDAITAHAAAAAAGTDASTSSAQSHRSLSLPVLRAAVDAFDAHIRGITRQRSFSFVDAVVPHIWEAALSLAVTDDDSAQAPMPAGRASWRSDAKDLILSKYTNGRLTFSAKDIHALLANAFLLNLNDMSKAIPDTGSLSFLHLYSSRSPVARERILCLLQYFYHNATHPSAAADLEAREIVYERVFFGRAGDGIEAARDALVPAAQVRVATGGMEEPRAGSFVDFANEMIHIHCVIPSATQEEVLFSACPEAFPAIVLFHTLLNDEVALIRSVRRHSAYTGYLDTFTFAGEYSAASKADLVETILVLDAVCWNHFDTACVQRDVRKAYEAFSAYLKASPVAGGGGDSRADYYSDSGAGGSGAAAGTNTTGDRTLSISTGHWGCGVFGGDKSHKFVQQLLAFSAACAALPPRAARAATLHYSSFGEADLAARFRDWLDAAARRKLTVGQLRAMLEGYQVRRTAKLGHGGIAVEAHNRAQAQVGFAEFFEAALKNQ